MFGGTLPLKAILVVVGSITTILLTLLVSYSFRELAVSSLTEQIGRSAAVLADQLEYKLDSDLLERSRHLEATSRLISPLIGGERPRTIAFLEQTRANYDDLIWVAVFDLHGAIQGEAGFQPRDVGDEKWSFKNSFLQAAIESNKVQGPNVVLAPLKPGKDGPGYVELATPVLGANGSPIAILTAYFSWDWAEELGRSLGGHSTVSQAMQLLVVTNGGRVLVGPAMATEQILSLPSFKGSLTSTNGFKVETWPQGEQYVTGFSKSKQDSFVDGQDWIVLVRQNATAALEPVAQIQRNLIAYAILSGLVAILIHWFLAGQIVRPLLKISQAADRLRRNENVAIPTTLQFSEVKTLSNSLASLVVSLKAREASLEALSSTLEQQVSERTQTLAVQNRALEVAKLAAEEATRAKTRFIAAASHDLRQPLQALSLFANSLSGRLQGTANAYIAGNIEQSITSLREMFDALLHVSRLDAGLIDCEKSNVALAPLMARMAAEFRLNAAQRGLEFRCVIPDYWIVTEPALFEVIIRNLLSNAVKFTNAGGILVGARKRGDKVAIEIYDTGPGIPVEQQTAVFREFERSKTQANGPNDGLGLGLSIAERYGRLIDAEIQVHSRPGQGTRFSVIVQKAAEVAIVENIAHRSRSNLSGLSLMLLDDSAKHLESLSLFLRDRGATVRTFSTAETALKALRNGMLIDVAVVDYDLGGMITGVEFLDLWYSERRNFEAIVLTGRTDADALKAITRSGKSWITKPAEPEMIAAIVSRLAIKARSARSETQSMAV